MNNPIRILLVDDSPHFIEVVRDFLGMRESFNVIGAAMDGSEAIKQSRLLEPDIILLDLNLASISGLDLIPLFKRHIPRTKIVVLTIMKEEAYRLAAAQAGADAFLHKDSMFRSLVPTLLELMKASSNGRFPAQSSGGDRQETKTIP